MKVRKKTSEKGASPGGGKMEIAEGEPTPEAVKSQSEAMLAPGLYVTATPIGNASDISLRALKVLRGCDAILAEDTRVTAKLLAIHGISKPSSPYNDHNAARERPRFLKRLSAGARLALVSDAGTPLLSDPGYKLVREAIAEGIAVHAIPGASALLTALTLAGLPTDRFLFAGFLPPRHGERCSALADLKGLKASLVFYEAPQRLAESLADMGEVLGPRRAAVARELTKLHEEVRRDTLEALAAHYAEAGPPRGEVTVVVGPPQETEPDFARADHLLAQALAFMPVRAAADLVAEALELPRRALYTRALALKSGHE
jgi:16S rRNA (cytidine1402-2'-O)-methyltransferase